MDYKELILSTLRGEPTDTVPFIPRLDIWYNANKRNGTLPFKYRNATLMEITDDLGLGFHSIIPQFRDFEYDNGDIDTGLGIYRFRNMLYTVSFNEIEQKISREPDGMNRVEYITPYGNIRTCFRYDDEMRRNGSTLAVILEHAVKGVQDFEALAYIFKHAEVKPDYSHFKEYKEAVIGKKGIAVGYSSVCASPVHYLLKELMAVDTFFYMLNDYPEEMEWLAGKLSGFCSRIFLIAANSPAELILSGANYDSSITNPPFFDKYIADELKKQADMLHGMGKFLVTHTDGENAGLLDSYLACGFDVADSICPAPMTRLTLKEIREKFESKITIWGGIPSISMLENAMSEYEFDRYIDSLLGSIGGGDHIILSIADTAPPATKFDRIIKTAQKVRQFGPVRVTENNN